MTVHSDRHYQPSHSRVSTPPVDLAGSYHMKNQVYIGAFIHTTCAPIMIGCVESCVPQQPPLHPIGESWSYRVTIRWFHSTAGVSHGQQPCTSHHVLRGRTILPNEWASFSKRVDVIPFHSRRLSILQEWAKSEIDATSAAVLPASPLWNSTSPTQPWSDWDEYILLTALTQAMMIGYRDVAGFLSHFRYERQNESDQHRSEIIRRLHRLVNHLVQAESVMKRELESRELNSNPVSKERMPLFEGQASFISSHLESFQQQPNPFASTLSLDAAGELSAQTSTSVRPSTAPPSTTRSTVGDSARFAAGQSRKRRDEYLQRSLVALAVDDRVEAERLWNLSKDEGRKMEESNAEAARLYFEDNNAWRDLTTIDLHRLHVKEALTKVNERLYALCLTDFSVPLEIIVGCGNHSIDHQPKLKPEVLNLLAEHRHLCAKDNYPHPGCITVVCEVGFVKVGPGRSRRSATRNNSAQFELKRNYKGKTNSNYLVSR